VPQDGRNGPAHHQATPSGSEHRRSIGRGWSRENACHRCSLIEEINLLCKWSGNEKNHVVAELLRDALSQKSEFQEYKGSLAHGTEAESSSIVEPDGQQSISQRKAYSSAVAKWQPHSSKHPVIGSRSLTWCAIIATSILVIISFSVGARDYNSGPQQCNMPKQHQFDICTSFFTTSFVTKSEQENGTTSHSTYGQCRTKPAFSLTASISTEKSIILMEDQGGPITPVPVNPKIPDVDLPIFPDLIFEPI
jgi:hypothetical protein